MEQLSFNFMDDPKYNTAECFSIDLDIIVTEDQLIQEANALADVYLNISGMDALCMAARGDFYDTDLEGSLLHSNLRRIAFLLNMY